MIVTLKCAPVSIFLARRFSKSLAFCAFASVNFEPCVQQHVIPVKWDWDHDGILDNFTWIFLYCFMIWLFLSRN